MQFKKMSCVLIKRNENNAGQDPLNNRCVNTVSLGNLYVTHSHVILDSASPVRSVHFVRRLCLAGLKRPPITSSRSMVNVPVDYSRDC